uniref:Uncharacterized protein n=1 Tax=Parascaris univalens TaxID=6257 RepID=A0A915A1K4_PARUN
MASVTMDRRRSDRGVLAAGTSNEKLQWDHKGTLRALAENGQGGGARTIRESSRSKDSIVGPTRLVAVAAGKSGWVDILCRNRTKLEFSYFLLACCSFGTEDSSGIFAVSSMLYTRLELVDSWEDFVVRLIEIVGAKVIRYEYTVRFFKAARKLSGALGRSGSACPTIRAMTVRNAFVTDTEQDIRRLEDTDPFGLDSLFAEFYGRKNFSSDESERKPNQTVDV